MPEKEKKGGRTNRGGVNTKKSEERKRGSLFGEKKKVRGAPSSQETGRLAGERKRGSNEKNKKPN